MTPGRLDLHVLQGGTLDFGEAPHLGLREADIRDGLRRQLGVAGIDLGP